MRDPIERQAAIDALMAILDKPNHAEFLYTDEICKTLNDLLPAQPEERTGERAETHACDCISRQAAIDALHMHLMYRMGTDSNKKRLDEWINNLPSAHPEIIRCKDCKWKYVHNCTRAVELFINDDCYCSWAERREE